MLYRNCNVSSCVRPKGRGAAGALVAELGIVLVRGLSPAVAVPVPPPDDVDPSRGCMVVGTGLGDVPVGTDGDDVICGGGGGDTILAGGGADGGVVLFGPRRRAHLKAARRGLQR